VDGPELDLEVASCLDNPVAQVVLEAVESYALILNSYAVETRYPGEYCEPEHADAEEALRIASEMFGLAKRKLGV